METEINTLANEKKNMEDMHFIKDAKGRIVKVTRDKFYATITWPNSSVDIDFCNFVIMIACETRGVGQKDV